MNIETIHELHEAMGLGKPKHPLITVIDFAKTTDNYSEHAHRIATNLYGINLKNQLPGEMKYGRKKYDFQEGTIMFLAPGQTMEIQPDETNYLELEGWGLFFHPDLLRRSALSKRIGDYNFFSYELNESLHLSEKEKLILNGTIERIEFELDNNIDNSSQPLIIANIELLLEYCSRFYNRQFITRSTFDSDYIARFKKKLSNYFNAEVQKEKGIPGVSYFAEQLHLSPKYFSDLVRNETGRNAMDHIHHFILEKAKNRLLSTNDSVNEIAYELGFEYPQYFSRIFKKKIGVSPLQYRNQN
ncbi:AraC family transcriptional regulator [Prolixibacteraceae bacterium JC049]|nr:AraC family transcriptional regulator [Prolixibacteraceae bacterium JC049]